MHGAGISAILTFRLINKVHLIIDEKLARFIISRLFSLNQKSVFKLAKKID